MDPTTSRPVLCFVIACLIAGVPGCAADGDPVGTGGSDTGGAGAATADDGGGGLGVGGRDGPGGQSGVGGQGGEGVVIDPRAGVYREACDGSAGVFIDHDHFVDANDENQLLRVYARGQDAAPIQTFETSDDIGLDTSDEADIEGGARLGDRIYWITSHGRNKNGVLEESRYRFFATDINGSVPDVSFEVPGRYESLLEEMLESSNWLAPHAEVIALLDERSQLDEDTVEDLAPKINGTCIEGLAAAPTATDAQRLLIGFRNPLYESKAIVVTLLNPDAVLTQQTTPTFGEAILLDLAGLGVRAMTYSPFHDAVIIVAGAPTADGAFKLYKWKGTAEDPPELVQDLVVPADSSPEAVVVFPDSLYVQVLLDQGTTQINGEDCKDGALADQKFTDLILKID
ncbi:MAG: DUF3616 domain-containing protein [Polyangiaceae bacterium]|nr:DUF3616 domain-containing protein [Polyangiaceae bacterium]